MTTALHPDLENALFQAFEHLCRYASISSIRENIRAHTPPVSESLIPHSIATLRRMQTAHQSHIEIMEAVTHSEPKKTSQTSQVISPLDMKAFFKAIRKKSSKSHIKWLLWEFDDNLDGVIGWEEFRTGCSRNLSDSEGLALNQLFHIAIFLVCVPDETSSISMLELIDKLQKLRGTERIVEKVVLNLESLEKEPARRLSLKEFLEKMSADLPETYAKVDFL
uniref:Uncharacterized protein AlNc14C391G11281 n=1 Tax=Albugo laibachii Nc14 TaxID=890382 RepID=F0WYL7_9STRA|nr:conserved hypothetical protein [Albugo laibachii Nc14]CCA27300.1 conserved hypothetical protein [Albugo laibachii Nc14]|eukprot:CCA27300.1 conserved hypothetical protein [Albugo laibachii Nc14]